LPLVFVFHSESNFGVSRLRDDITPATHNDRTTSFFKDRYQTDLFNEVDIEIVINLFVAEVALLREKSAVK